MGNTGLTRRNSLFMKQDSSSSEKRLTRSSRQNTILEEEVTREPAPAPEPLNDKQKALLIETWKILEQDIAKVGVITFISLFETHPDVQQVFMPFSGIELEELKHSKQLRAHALRVMAFVQKAVARLYEPEKLDALIHDLGKKHFGYGAKQKYVDLVGPQFIQAIIPALESKWTEEVNEAWTKLFQYIAHMMKDAIDMEEFYYKKSPKNN